MKELTDEEIEKSSEFFAAIRTFLFGILSFGLAANLGMDAGNSAIIGLLAFLLFIRLGRS